MKKIVPEMRADSISGMIFTGELGVTLTPGTEYSYQFYVIYDNVEYQGAKETFTTTGTASKAQDDTVEMSRECGPAPSLDYARDGWLSLQELARSSEQALHDRMWDPEKEVGNKKYYAPERCGVFSTMAPVMAEMGNDRVDSITWKYTYPDKSYKAESKEFYEGVAEAGNEVLGMTGTGICENKNHMTTTWNGVASLQWRHGRRRADNYYYSRVIEKNRLRVKLMLKESGSPRLRS